MAVYFKATRPDGTDFYSGTVAYRVGETVSVSESARRRTAACCTGSVLHASTVPAETLTGGKWPCRLFEVTGRPVAEEGHKRGFRKVTILREVDAYLALGPQGEHVAALIQRAGSLRAARHAAGHTAWYAARNTARHAAGYAAWDTAGYAARYAARDAARDAAGYAARDTAGYADGHAAGYAARDAAGALVIRDLITPTGFTQDHYDLLTRSWASVIGPVHPDDKPEGVVA